VGFGNICDINQDNAQKFTPGCAIQMKPIQTGFQSFLQAGITAFSQPRILRLGAGQEAKNQ
jgi:hypothetical protein